MSDRFLPDKAIDLIDESASRVRMYKSDAATIRQGPIQPVEAGPAKTGRWLRRKARRKTCSTWEAQEADLERAAQAPEAPAGTGPTARSLPPMISPRWSPCGPASRSCRSPRKKSQRLLKMEEELHKAIIGQDEAIKAIAKAVRRARAGLKDPRRPIGSFIFLGPTGVGKTELTKALAKFMFGSEEALIQLDMSEFMERHTASPPGRRPSRLYRLRGRRPADRRHCAAAPIPLSSSMRSRRRIRKFTTCCCRSWKKAISPMPAATRWTFRNAIIVMTSNIGADEIKRQTALGFQLKREEKNEERNSYEEMRKKLTESLKKIFRPEFINRVDSVIVFRALNKSDIREIVSLELHKVTERLAEHAVTLTASDAALDLLAEQGYDPEMGARPLRRVIQQKVEDPLSDGLLSGDFNEGDTILVEVADGEPILRRQILKTEAAPARRAKRMSFYAGRPMGRPDPELKGCIYG